MYTLFIMYFVAAIPGQVPYTQQLVRYDLTYQQCQSAKAQEVSNILRRGDNVVRADCIRVN